ncbi:cytochrome P450 [Imleria badia]|nr:cytochrome P450 [Imleria badia]
MFLQAFERISTLDCLVGITVTAATVTFLYKRRRAALTSKNGLPLPPGPPARWFWENAMPSVNIARTLADWVTEFGPVITLCQGNHIVVVIGRVDAATEIMEKEGSALADRPRSIAAGEMASNDMRFVLLRSGERFRRFRKAAHTHLQPKAARSYEDVQLETTKDVIVDILNDPKNHQAHVQRFAASVVLRMVYGKSVPTSNDDPELSRIHQAARNFGRSMRPGAYLVDLLPFLKWIPGYGRELKEFYNFEMQLFRDQMERVQSEMETNLSASGNSFMRVLLENTDQHRLSRDEMAYLAGDIFGAGADTSAVAITNMIMAAACYPEAQKRVQEELDMVVGKDRMPTWEDSESLPQVHAYILETLRWRPVTPIGFAHRATQDIVWRGECIPAGASVLGCHWAISRDPEVFPNPEKFDPRRWIDDNGRLRNNMTSYPFGFGRRVCPGQHVANKSLYINLVLLLWSFHIEERADAPIDTNGHSNGVVAHAAPFDVKFIPRIEEGLLKQMMSGSVI